MSFRPDFIEYTLPGYLSVTPLGAWMVPSTFSRGLVDPAVGGDSLLEWTVEDMRECWVVLTLEEVFSASIFLYNRGYRREALFWYYVAAARLDYLGRVADGASEYAVEVFGRGGLFLEGLRPWMSGYAYFHPDVFSLFLDQLPRDLGSVVWGKIYPKVPLMNGSEGAIGEVCGRFHRCRPSFFGESLLPGFLAGDDRFASLRSESFPRGWV